MKTPMNTLVYLRGFMLRSAGTGTPVHLLLLVTLRVLGM
jgi:hypothetical protein